MLMSLAIRSFYKPLCCLDKMRKEVLALAFILFISLILYLRLYITGYDVLQDDETMIGQGAVREVQAGKCTDLYPAESIDYYVDPEGKCAPCSDSNEGSVNKPWCTIQRALDTKKTVHFKGGERLYLRGGIHRYDSLKLPITRPDGSAYEGYLDGTMDRPTTVSSYPDELASIYASERPSGWEKRTLSDNSVVWVLNWREYLEKNFPLYLQKKNFFFSDAFSTGSSPEAEFLQTPQSVFIDSFDTEISKPVILRQANESQIAVRSYRGASNPLDTSASLYYKDYQSMPEGYAYYDNRISSENFGLLYVKLPSELRGRDANSLPIEIPLDYVSFLGPYVHKIVLIANLSFRFSNSMLDYEGGSYYNGHDGGLMFNSPYGKLENVDLSYHAFRGAVGSCDHCRIINSTFSYNGNTGSGLIGNNITYERNVFRRNSQRLFNLAWNAGGMKLIAPLFNFTIHNNLFQDDGASIGLWLDFTGDGWNIVEQIKRGEVEINWDNYIGAGHLIDGNVFWNDGLAIETSPGSVTRPIFIKNNLFLGENNTLKKAINIQSSPFVIIENNLFSNLYQAIVVDTIINWQASEKEFKVRSRQTDVQVSKNIFLNVSFPIVFGEETSYSLPSNPLVFIRNTADNNIYYGTRKPNPVFRRIVENVDFSQKFAPHSASHPLNQLRSYNVHLSAYDKDNDFTNGISPNIGLEEDDYEWYKRQNINELENTVYFSKALLLSYDYLDWGVHNKYTFNDWRERTGNDIHSTTENPRILFTSAGESTFPTDSPAQKLGIQKLDFISVPLPRATLRILTPEGRDYAHNVLGLNYYYDGPPLRSCWYSLDGGATNITFVCGMNVTSINSAEGMNIWSIFLQDELLRVHTKDITFFVDSIPPNIWGMSVVPTSPALFRDEQQYTFSVNVYDASIVTLVLDGQEHPASLDNGKYLVRVSNLDVGSHQYFWETFDSIGNLKRGEMQTYVVEAPLVVPPVDSSVPTLDSHIIILEPRSTLYNKSLGNLQYLLIGSFSTCWYSLDNGLTNTTITCGMNVTGLPFGEGAFIWLVGGRDIFGRNITDRTSFSVDKTAPDLAFVVPTPVSGSVLQQDFIELNVSSSARDISRLEFSVFQGGVERGRGGNRGPSLYRNLSLSSGEYVLAAYVIDLAGNSRRIGPVQVTLAPRSNVPVPKLVPAPSLTPTVPDTITIPLHELITHELSENKLVSGVSLRIYEGDGVVFSDKPDEPILIIQRIEESHLVLTYLGKTYALVLGRPYSLLLDGDIRHPVIIEVGSLSPEHNLATVLFEQPHVVVRTSQSVQDSQASQSSSALTVPASPPILTNNGDGFGYTTGNSESVVSINESTAESSLGEKDGEESGTPNLSLKIILGALVIILLIGIVVFWYFYSE